MCDSEAESLIVHTNGDANLEDFLSETEFETDVEFENNNGIKEEYQNSSPTDPSLKLEPRGKTRLLSRSQSVSDLNDSLNISADPPRRNSSGEYPTSLSEREVLSPKPTANLFLQDIELPKHRNGNIRNSFTPTSTHQPSPVFMQYPSPASWRNNSNQDKEDEFSILLQATAERVLNKLKSRQQDLGSTLSLGQKYQRRPSQNLLPLVPRKLEPITRDDNRTPKPEGDLKNVNSDSPVGSL